MKTSAFLGSKKLGLEILKTMHVLAPQSLSVIMTIDDSKDSRSCLEQYKEFANSIGKPFRIVSNNSNLENTIHEFSPDCCIVNGYYRILKPELLACFPSGCLGIHGSLLPKYRGGSPLVWAMINGETTSGISFFYFDSGMDTGDIIGQKSFQIEDNDSIANILEKVESLSVELINECYLRILDGTIIGVKQDHSQATYAAIRQPIDGKIIWNWSARKVYDFIRAQSDPYPGAYGLLENGEKLTIWNAGIFPFPFYGTPGQVVQLIPEGVVISTGESTAIIINDVQKEGDKIQKANQVLGFFDRLY